MTGCFGGRTFLAVICLTIAACSPEPAPQRAGGDDLQAVSHPGRAIFDGACFACHSIGEGDRIGPDLDGVHLRREREWLVRWLRDPIGMATSDSIGRALFAQYQSVPMPPSGLTDEEIDQVLDYLQAVSSFTTTPEN